MPGDPPLSVDVLLIGAGPTGAVAGALLARRGFRVLTLEKQWFPRHVIGESLLPRCNELLHRAGLLAAVEARGYTIKHGATFLRGTDTQRFAFKNSMAGDFISTFQVPRDDFDQTLISAARAQGVEVRFGHEAKSFHTESGGVTAGFTELEGDVSREVRARFVLDCSGPARVVSRLLKLEEPSALAPRCSVYTHVEGDQRSEGESAGDTWVVIHETGAWLWVIPFSNGRSSVGAVAEPALLERVAGATDGEKLRSLIESDPALRERLRGAVPVQPTRRLQGWSTATRRLHGPGWAIAGNAGDFLDPVFSSGVMLALESGAMAADCIARQLGGEAVDWDKEYQAPLRRAIDIFRTFVDAWYKGELAEIFFCQKKPRQEILQITSVLGGNVFNEQNPLVTGDTRAALDRMLAGVEVIQRVLESRKPS